MKELLRANDMVLISFACSLLEGEGVEHVLLDTNMSVLDGSIGAIPRRLLVGDEDHDRARRILSEHGLRHELRPA
ncbi:DUF2007 domain-containing protein [Terrihabitans rhizophilus]|jgi:hypothetical protein|uniref:DUF2007 domain-containing protein n=1 Tax=Terrihabitans rhizophilus TaxID=3092662 RepID=A0ABU4RR75_9HYPH|nr:DUF2007 domain-containing protein [Terrihabitans sp. PJ23]MDX6807352.1 DUF2007 domain-containing protein [Terrihabitans sp. PJ23]